MAGHSNTRTRDVVQRMLADPARRVDALQWLADRVEHAAIPEQGLLDLIPDALDDLDHQESVALAKCFAAVDHPIPTQACEQGARTAVEAWRRTALCRDAHASVPLCGLLATMPWRWVRDPAALLDRAVDEDPVEALRGLSAALEACAVDVGVAEAIWRRCYAVEPWEALRVAREPWTRACADMWEDIVVEGELSELALDALQHGVVAERVVVESLVPSMRAMVRSTGQEMSFNELGEVGPNPVERLGAMSRASLGAVRWTPSPARLVPLLRRFPTAIPEMSDLLRHQEKEWIDALADIRLDDPVWLPLIDVLAEMRHPAAVLRLQSLWVQRDLRTRLANPLADAGCAVVLEMEEALSDQALARLPARCRGDVQAAFDKRPTPRLAAWLCAQTDAHDVVELGVLDHLQDAYAAYDGVPDVVAIRWMQEARQCGAHDRIQWIAALGARGPRRSSAVLVEALAEPLPTHQPGFPPDTALADAALQALVTLGERLHRRGVRWAYGEDFVQHTLRREIERSAPQTAGLDRLLSVLLEYGPSGEVPSNLSTLIRKGPVEVRKHAIRMLGAPAPRSLARQALPWLEHDDPKLLRAAAQVLEGCPWAESHLTALLTAPNMNVRRTAACALAKASCPASVEPIVQALGAHDNAGLQAELWAALTHLVGSAAVSLLVDVDTPQARLALARHLPDGCWVQLARRRPELGDSLRAALAERTRSWWRDAPSASWNDEDASIITLELDALLDDGPDAVPALRDRLRNADARTRERVVAEVRRWPPHRRVLLAEVLELPLDAEERRLASDPSHPAYAYALTARLAMREVDLDEWMPLMTRPDDMLVDYGFRRGWHAELLRAAVDAGWLSALEACWRPHPQRSTISLLSELGHPAALEWRGRLSGGGVEFWVQNLRRDARSRAQAIDALIAHGCDPELLVPLLDEGPRVAQAAAQVLTGLAQWGTPCAEMLLAKAFVERRLVQVPVVGSMTLHELQGSPLTRMVELLMQSRLDATERLQWLDHQVADSPEDRQALAAGYGSLPWRLFEEQVLQGAPIPDGVVPHGMLPHVLVDRLCGEDDECGLRLLTRWRAPLNHPRLADLFHRHRADPRMIEVLPRLGWCQRHPDGLLPIIADLAEVHGEALMPAVETIAAGLPKTRQLPWLLAVEGLDVCELVLDRVLMPVNHGAGKTHPIDQLEGRWPARLWKRVREQTRSRELATARRALWALRGGPWFLDALLDAHDHPDSRMRTYANRLLRREGPVDAWLDATMGLLSDRSAPLRRHAMRALAWRGYLPAVPVLLSQLHEQRHGKQAREALLVYGEVALPELDRALLRMRPDRRAQVEALMEEMRA